MTVIEGPKEGQSGLPSVNPTASFWHTQPSKLLHNHHTTPSLPTATDVVIIGSGISGAFAAHYLAEFSPETSITMIEAREACSGATGRNGGHCQPKPYGKPVHMAKFELDNFEVLRDMIQLEGIECDFQQVQACHGFFDSDMFEEAVKSVARFKDEAPACMRDGVRAVRDRALLKEMSLNENVVGAVVIDSAASLWPYKLVAWVLEKLLQEKSGSAGGWFNLQTHTEVTRLQQLDGGSWIVHTSRGMMEAKKVLLSTNAYTSHLLASFIDLIVPVRGEMASLVPPESLRDKLSGYHSYAFLGNGSDTTQKDEYLIQRPPGVGGKPGGELMFGGGRRFAKGSGVGVWDDSAVDKETKIFLRNDLNHVLNTQTQEQRPLEPTFEWSGIMGFSRDGAPWVGEVPKDLGGGSGLYLCAGFTGHGMPNAVLCARDVARDMFGLESDKLRAPEEFRISTKRAAEALKRPKISSIKVSGAIGPIEEAE